MGYKMSGPSLYPNIQRSSQGYREGHTPSESKIITSNKISMCELDGSPLEAGPIKGTGLTTGQTKIMEPGSSYTFAGDKEVLETPITYKSPLLEKKSRAKWRKDGTLKKVVTVDKETGYRSVIRFDKEGRIKSAKNNQTKNKYKKSTQRLSRANWIKEDMAVYSNDPSIISTKDYGPKKKEVEETIEEKRNRIYRGTKHYGKEEEVPLTMSINDKTQILINEGYESDQAYAIAHDMKRKNKI